jgi:hypothetical protein
MKLSRSTILIFCIAFVAAIALGVTARWQRFEAARLADEESSLRETRTELELTRAEVDKTRAELERSVDEAQNETQELKAAIKSSQKYQETQRTQVARTVGLANALTAAASIKTAMTEYFLTEGKWPAANEEMGLPAPTSFKSKGVRSVGVVPGGGIQLVVDDLGKRADVRLNAKSNDAGQVVWNCESSSIPDIAHLVPGCVYKAR